MSLASKAAEPKRLRPSVADAGRSRDDFRVQQAAVLPTTRASRAAARTPPEAFFVGSAVFHYLGPAFAVLLFALVEPLGVAWLRIVTAAVVFALWRKPWRVLDTLDRSGLRTVVAIGVVLAVMNACFYIAIDRLPLGTVAAIEFLPVIALAAVGMRTARNAVALGSAVAGVYLLTDVRIEGEPIGVAFAFANAGLFAAYIVLAHRVARLGRIGGIDGPGAPRSDRRRRRRRCRHLVIGDPVRVRPVGDGETDPGSLLADGLAAARHCNRDRDRRARADPILARGRRSQPRGRSGGRAPRGSADGLMEYVRLGTSGLRVSRICLGMMSYGDPTVRAWQLPEEDAEPIVRHAVEEGVTFFDTADMYSRGRSEEITGRLLARFFPSRDDYVLATKAYFPTGPGPNDRGLSRKHLLAAVDASLRRIGTDYVDLYQIHRWDYETPIEETMAALHDIVRAGKARYIGASSMYAWEFAKAQYTARTAGWTSFVSMQNHYNLVYREEEREMIPLCLDEGVGVLPWSPLARGLLAGSRTRGGAETTVRSGSDPVAEMYEESDFDVVDVVREVADARGLPPAQIALAWLLGKPAVTAPIVGATKLGHLQDAIAATDVRLTEEESRRLEAPYRPHPILGHPD